MFFFPPPPPSKPRNLGIGGKGGKRGGRGDPFPAVKDGVDSGFLVTAAGRIALASSSSHGNFSVSEKWEMSGAMNGGGRGGGVK